MDRRSLWRKALPCRRRRLHLCVELPDRDARPAGAELAIERFALLHRFHREHSAERHQGAAGAQAARNQAGGPTGEVKDSFTRPPGSPMSAESSIPHPEAPAIREPALRLPWGLAAYIA